MGNDAKLPRRRSIRLEGWDYSQSGGYFVTVVAHQRIELFGQVIDDEVSLSTGGKIIESVWRGLSSRFPWVELGEYVIMPNHLHGIIIIHDNVGAPLVGARQEDAGERAATRVAPTGSGQEDAFERAAARAAPTVINKKRPTLGQIIGAFKSISTCEYILAVQRGIASPFRGQLWQRNYYEHIIRDEKEMALIHLYIQGNPARWAEDEENPLH